MCSKPYYNSLVSILENNVNHLRDFTSFVWRAINIKNQDWIEDFPSIDLPDMNKVLVNEATCGSRVKEHLDRANFLYVHSF